MLVSVLQSDGNMAFIYSDSTELWDKHSRGSLCSTSDQESLLQQISSSPPHTHVGWPVPHIAPSTQGGLLSEENVFREHT